MSERLLGEPLPRGRRSRRLFVTGILLVALGFAALIVMALYVSRGLENGPRWLAANYLVLEIALLLFAAGGSLMAFAHFPGLWNALRGTDVAVERGGGYVVMGLLSAFLLVVVALDLPASARDAFGPLERRSLDITDWAVESNGTAVVRTGTGETFRWSETFGLLKYPQMLPGRYEVLLTSERHWIVGATRAD